MLIKQVRLACNRLRTAWDCEQDDDRATKDVKCRRTHVNGLGFLYIVDENSNLDAVRMLMCAVSYRPEFCFARDIRARLIMDLMYLGYIPMGQLDTTDHKYSMVPKLHKHRCVLHFPDLKVEKSARKRLKQFRISVNKCFDRVVDECVRINGDGWLVVPLVRVLKELHHAPECTAIRLCSFEIYNNDELVGGEIGFTAGAAYTSLSGYFTMRSAGTVQMIATCKILQSAGFAFWDLGMELPYKRRLGATTHPIRDFLAVFDTVKCLETPILPSAVLDVRDIVMAQRYQHCARTGNTAQANFEDTKFGAGVYDVYAIPHENNALDVAEIPQAA